MKKKKVSNDKKLKLVKQVVKSQLGSATGGTCGDTINTQCQVVIDTKTKDF